MTTPQPAALPEQVWLMYAKKKPSLRRLSFVNDLSSQEKASGWVSEPYALAALQSQPAAPQGVLMRLAAIAAECSDPDTTDALDALIASTPEQPAAAVVSDDDIYKLWVRHCETTEMTTRQIVCGFARAILALRPQAVPMTDEVKEQALDLLATMFDAYENGVPCYEGNGGGYIGMAFSLDNETFHACADILNAHRPKAHHGITAQGAQGEQG